jgi:hypothetical protein
MEQENSCMIRAVIFDMDGVSLPAGVDVDLHLLADEEGRPAGGIGR